MSIEKLEARASTNPFAVKIAKSELTTNSKDVYENLVERTAVAFNPSRKERRALKSAMAKLQKRMSKGKALSALTHKIGRCVYLGAHESL